MTATTTVLHAIWKKFHALEYRLFLFEEISRLKTVSKILPPDIHSLVWRNPSVYEDFVNMLCFLNPEDKTTLIDVGANIGEFTNNFLVFFPNSTVYAYEPTTRPFNALINRFANEPRVHAFKYALAKENGERAINLGESTELSSFLLYNDEANAYRQTRVDKKENVDCRRFDSLNLVINNGSQIVVKVDVQGFEEEVIAGFGDNWKWVDLLIIEVSFAPEYQKIKPTFSPICTALAQFGLFPIIFQRYGRQQNTYGIERDVIFVRENWLKKVYWKYYG